MLGFLLEILGELVEQLIGEALIEGVWHLLGRPFEASTVMVLSMAAAPFVAQPSDLQKPGVCAREAAKIVGKEPLIVAKGVPAPRKVRNVRPVFPEPLDRTNGLHAPTAYHEGQEGRKAIKGCSRAARHVPHGRLGPASQTASANICL